MPHNSEKQDIYLVKILLPIHGLFPLDYLADSSNLKIGDLVIVPFRNKEITSIVWSVPVKIDDIETFGKIKFRYIKEKITFCSSIGATIIELIKKTSSYYLSELGSVAKLVLSVEISESPIIIEEQKICDHFSLSPLSEAQQQILEQLKSTSKPSVLKGVTGSGKTEIYFHLAAEYLKQGQQILILLPEISLSKQIVLRFSQRFNFEPIIWNSLTTKARKKRYLRGVINGKIQAIIGTRSSLFLPYQNLGLIIVDEEHDPSYKQEEGVLYNARDMAVLNASLSNATKVILCSATPSIETIYNGIIGKYKMIELSDRYKEASLPKVKITNLLQEKIPTNRWISPSLVKAMNETLAKNEQILLFLNRRGYAPLTLCRNCGYRFECKFCSSWLVTHKSTKKLECHHCGYHRSIIINCPECEEEGSLVECGPGVERIEEEARIVFPDYKIVTISKDTKVDEVQILLKKMENREIDILIGTQIITKGYHFPYLTLVGVVDADLGFNGNDLRSSERTFQLLHQVGGRAGRGERKGTVMLQTYYPENIVFNVMRDGKIQDFIDFELEQRKTIKMPPFAKMASILLTGKNDQQIHQIAKKLTQIAPNIDNLRMLGPAKSTMHKMEGKYRYRILVIADKLTNLQKYISTWIKSVKIPSSCHIKIDIDPQSFF